jgi:hypothetical protein
VRSPEGQLYESLVKSVFRIEAGLGHGSGFLVDASGLIVTNDHVIGVADEVTVYLEPEVRVAATIVRRDVDADLALIRVSPLLVGGRPPLTLATTPAAVAPGDRVVALGYPLNQPLTMTAGMVANIRAEALLTDALLNPGNSGGPILLMNGTVVAVTTFIDQATTGPGLGGAILVDRLHRFLEGTPAGAGPSASDRRLPTFPLATYPVSALRSIADTIQPLLFTSLGSVKAGPFLITTSTPLSGMLSAVTTGREISKDRRKREARADVPAGQRFVDGGAVRDWAAYVGDQTAPVVAVKVEPLFGETGGSAFRRGFLTALVGVGGQATVRFQGDVRKVILRRNGEVVEPLRGGHAPVAIGVDNALVDFNDVADFGYYLYSPQTFRPDGPQRPPAIVLEIEDLKKPGVPQRATLSPAVVARLWNDFESFYVHATPETPFLRYAMTRSCKVSSGAAAMGAVASGAIAGEVGDCTYIVAPPAPAR